MSTTLSPDFLRNVILVSSFRGDDHHRICAALLIIGLRGQEFDAGMVPAELCGDSQTALGIATGALIAQNLLEICGRVRSSSVKANGRKVNALRVPANRYATVKAWLSRHGYIDTAPAQQTELTLA